jgi:copper chaperone CopZ
MKLLRIFLMLGVVLTLTLSAEAQKKNEKTVVFKAHLHCMSCKAKIEKNLPFEKGVKDLKIDMQEKTITVTFREDKNSLENIQKALEKLDVKVEGVEEKVCEKKKNKK